MMFFELSAHRVFGLLAICFLPPALSTPISHENGTSVTTLQVIPETQSLENIAVRNNGDLLVTSVASSTLFGLSPDREHPPIPVARISGVTGLLGIAELEKDIFYVVGSNLTSTENSNGVWKVDLRNFQAFRNGTILQTASVSLVTRIPSALQLNGMARLSTNDTKRLLISDSSRGTVIRLNVDTAVYETAVQEPEMAPLTTGLGIGVNGIRIRDNYLYFVSLDQGRFARVPISLASGEALGPVETLASGITFGDDFALSGDGRWAYVATNGPREVIGIDLLLGGKFVAATSPLLGSASSVARSTGNVWYVTGATPSGNSTVGHVSSVLFSCGV
ncbi:Putative six-bladed beta-propeller, TolB [Colletotrichum destructivum]|uniref:Six-bladed beta-propeller, TolB n=1 Tax=Colletotrichum destructivum TaxID=34406 RepID=A0AAX4IH47_9PEZI|nr:Putative six-bladed beta-propeller, TolB [Colletotrichum destructivum]